MYTYLLVTSVLVTLVPISAASQQEYTIVPEGIALECPNLTNRTSCLTTKQLGNINQNDRNISIVFTAGNHWLSKRHAFVNISSLHLVGNNRSTLTCLGGSSGFSFENIEILIMENLDIKGCLQILLKGGAVSTRNVDTLQITKCNFLDNEALMNGGAIHIEHSDLVIINDSSFFNNSVLCATCKGGALDILNTRTVRINNSIFKLNRAIFKWNTANFGIGGAISSVASQVSITGSIFTSNIAGRNGGAIAIQGLGSNISGTQFTTNQANTGGAIFVQDISLHMIILATNFSQNQAIRMGGAIHIQNCGGCIAKASSIGEMECQQMRTWSTYNNPSVGRSIFADSSTIYIIRNNYRHNTALVLGGAIFVFNSTVAIEQTNFTRNSALIHGGGAVFTQVSMLRIIQSYYMNNTSVFGGFISIIRSCVFIQESHYQGNFGDVGGVIFANDSVLISRSSVYMRNNASITGGVIAAFGSNTTVSLIEDEYVQNFAPAGGVAFATDIKNFESDNCTYSNNIARNGGAILAVQTSVQLRTSIFTGNTAFIPELQQPIIKTNNSLILVNAINGGAIRVDKCFVSSIGTDYVGNKATHFSGAIYASDSKLNIVGGKFTSNQAEKGAAIYVLANKTTIANSTFAYNKALNGGVLSALGAEINIVDQFFYLNNSGSVSIFDSKLTFQGEASFTHNHGTTGGAINSIQSRIEFTDSSTIIIRRNCAKFGGAMSLIETVCTISSSNVVIEYNIATENGGGIYAIQSQIELTPRKINDTTVIAHNTAYLNGGGFHVIASQTKLFRGLLLVSSNHAHERGGAFFLDSNSKIYINKMEREVIMGRKNVILNIEYNEAMIGGAVYIEDATTTGSLCKRAPSVNKEPLIPVQCFLQSIQLYLTPPLGEFKFISSPLGDFNFTATTTYNNVQFSNNTAKDTGSAIYGGLLDRCAVNPLSEVSNNQENITLYNGFDYIKLLVDFQGLIDYRALRMETENYPQNIIQSISKEQVYKLITSQAVKLCFCTQRGIDCDYSPSTIWTKKGETFWISLAAVDQLENPTKANLISTTKSTSGVHRLKEGQGNQILNNTCTKVKYNVFASDKSAQVEIHAQGPCRDLGTSMRILNISFNTCTCPVGFIPAPSDIECICLCHNELKNYVDEKQCIAENKSLSVIENVWIGLIPTKNGSNFIVHNCSFDYCVQKPFTLILDQVTIDEQCDYNRTGYLCGRCKEGLSLVFGTSKCDECSNSSLYQLILFALAGIALVVLILILNMTVAIGTTNGLIFYANILVANHSIFLQGDNFRPLTTFIAWINLDLGIETCFYDGMDTYSKFLLQLVFPVYIFILIAVIIIVSHYSSIISTLLGKKNPIATLSTLILLSYSKLLRMIIESFQFTTLQFPKGTAVVWLLDANVPYTDIKHIPRFIIAIVITIFGLVYTILLLFAQCFHSCSKRISWLHNPKYNAFIDAYHASFTPNSRYWVGLFLMLRIIHFCISAVGTEEITVLSVGCIIFFILSVRVMSTKTYKLWPNNVLENLFLVNLGLLAIFTYFIMLTNGQQATITDISLAIAFFMFIGITFYHIHEYILMNTKFYQRQVSKVHKTANKLIRRIKRVHTTDKTTQQTNDDCDYRVEAIAIGIDIMTNANPPIASQTSNTTFSVIEKTK